MAEIGGPEEAPRLWRVNRTIHELVKDRGYQIADEEIEMDLPTFKSRYGSSAGSIERNMLNFFTNKGGASTDHIFIFFTNEKSVGVTTMRKFVGILDEKSIKNGIIVFPSHMTPAARKVITSLTTQFRLEEFSESDLLVNITRHILVPPHEVLTSEEKATLLSKYRLKETQLPRIQLADPVARYYGLVRGQVVKIIRPSETAGRTRRPSSQA